MIFKRNRKIALLMSLQPPVVGHYSNRSHPTCLRIPICKQPVSVTLRRCLSFPTLCKLFNTFHASHFFKGKRQCWTVKCWRTNSGLSRGPVWWLGGLASLSRRGSGQHQSSRLIPRDPIKLSILRSYDYDFSDLMVLEEIITSIARLCAMQRH